MRVGVRVRVRVRIQVRARVRVKSVGNTEQPEVVKQVWD